MAILAVLVTVKQSLNEMSLYHDLQLSTGFPIEFAYKKLAVKVTNSDQVIPGCITVELIYQDPNV